MTRPPRASGWHANGRRVLPGAVLAEAERREVAALVLDDRPSAPTRSPVVVNGSVSVPRALPGAECPRSAGVPAGWSSVRAAPGDCGEKSEPPAVDRPQARAQAAQAA